MYIIKVLGVRCRYKAQADTGNQKLATCNFLWWLFRRCSPLPIPNREVKPAMADGTAKKCGRVGSCHIYLNRPGALLHTGRFLFGGVPQGEPGLVKRSKLGLPAGPLMVGTFGGFSGLYIIACLRV